jgi:hypothetical protein
MEVWLIAACGQLAKGTGSPRERGIFLVALAITTAPKPEQAPIIPAIKPIVSELIAF